MRREEKELIPTVAELNEMNRVADTISFNERVAKSLEVNLDTVTDTIKTGDNKEIEVVKKTYQLANPVGKRTTVTIYDMSIIESMEKIGNALHAKSILTYAICKEFSNIAKSEKLENLGFKNVAEFGKAFYGLETSTVNHYVRIGETFINDDYTVKNGLPDLSASHFIELGSLVKDGDISPIIELYATGTLVDGMSTKKIRETLKVLNGTALEDNFSKDEKTESPKNTADVIPSESEVQELKVNFDSQVVIGRIINACTIIDEMFTLLNEHEINAIGYAEKLDSVKAIAKALLQ